MLCVNLWLILCRPGCCTDTAVGCESPVIYGKCSSLLVSNCSTSKKSVASSFKTLPLTFAFSNYTQEIRTSPQCVFRNSFQECRWLALLARYTSPSPPNPSPPPTRPPPGVQAIFMKLHTHSKQHLRIMSPVVLRWVVVVMG